MGDRYVRLWRPDRQISKAGTFNSFKLWTGKNFIYNKDGVLERVAVYSDGRYLGDAPLPNIIPMRTSPPKNVYQPALAETQGIRTRDSTFIDHANTYINKKLGSDFVSKNLKFVSLYHAGLSIVVYETISTKNAEGRNAIILYFKYKTFEVDTVLSVWSKDEILKSINGDKNCTLYIGIEKATEIAKSSALKQGVKPWTIDMMNVLPSQTPKWYFNSIYNSSDGGYSSGAELHVNMTDGRMELSYWTAEP